MTEEQGEYRVGKSKDDFVKWLKLTDQLLEAATKEQIAETARILAMHLAHYQAKFGSLEYDDFGTLMETQEVDDDTALLLVNGMENLVGVLGMLIQDDEAEGQSTH